MHILQFAKKAENYGENSCCEYEIGVHAGAEISSQQWGVGF